MDERWYYRSFNDEVGPFDFREMQTLACEGVIGREDVIRTDTARAWVKAKTIPELFLEKVVDDDLAALLSSVEGDDSLAQSPRAKRNDECYCLLRGRERGPMTFEELGQLAQSGELQPQHNVRFGSGANWIKAGSIVGLFQEVSQDDVYVASGAELSDSDSDVRPVTRAKSPAPTPKPHRAEVRDSERNWYFRINGNETGPLTFDAVFQLAQGGRLERTDELRCGLRSSWMPASSVVGLFSNGPDSVDQDDQQDNEADDDFDLNDFLSDEPTPQPSTKRSIPARSSSRRDSRHSSAAPRPLADVRTAPAAPPRKTSVREASPAVAVQEPPTRPAMPDPVRPASTPTPSYVPPAYVPPRPMPVPQRAKSRSRSVEMNWTYVGGGAAALVLVGALWMFGLPSLSFGSGDVYDQTLAILNEAMLMHQPECEGDRWNGFKDRAQAKVSDLVPQLEKAGKGDPRQEVILRCCREYLPAILQAGPKKSTKEWNLMVESMQKMST
jgi:hypothetical protein